MSAEHDTLTDEIIHTALAAAPELKPGMAATEMLTLIEARRSAQYEALGKAIDAVLASCLPESQLEAEIGAISRWCSSEVRLYALLRVLSSKRVGDALFWRALANEWPVCDATWQEQQKLVRALRRRLPAPPIPDLPDEMTVFRGCSRRRVKAISWTLDRAVAESFARGHRGITVPQPVLAQARVGRADVFLYVTDRDESEIVLDPDRLRDMRLTSYEAR